MEIVTPDINLKVQVTNKQILKIALPIAISILVPQINFITNNIFLSGLGEQPLAVAGITGVFYLIFAVTGFGLNNGVQALISRRAGENRINEIGNLLNQALRISLAFSVIGILVVYFIAPAIFRASLNNPSNTQMAISFLYIRIWGLPFLYLYQMRNALLVGINQSKLLIIGTLAETLTNIFFDYGLIYGHFGLPKMGFNGAAVASIIAEATGFFTIFLVIHYSGIIKKLNLFHQFKYDAVITRIILKQSSPLILQYMISIISWEFFYILIEHHGETALAVSNTMRNIFGLFGCISWAFAATSNTMVSNVIGQGLQYKVSGLIIKIMRLSVAFAIIICIILNIAPSFFFQIYQQGNDFILAAVPVVRVVSLALVFMAVSTVWLNAVTGTGNTRINLYIEVAAIIIYCTYSFLILQKFNLPITVGWAAEWIYWITIFIPSFLYMKSGKWKNKKI